MGSENGRFVKRFGLGEAVVFCRFWEGNARSNDLGSFFFFRVVKRQGQVLFSKQTEVIFFQPGGMGRKYDFFQSQEPPHGEFCQKS